MRKNKILLYGILFVPKRRIKKVKHDLALRIKQEKQMRKKKSRR
jgi:hypothetical protein